MEQISILSEIIHFLTKYDRKYLLKNCYKLSNFKIYIFGVFVITTILVLLNYFVITEENKVPVFIFFLFVNIFYFLVNLFAFFSTYAKIELYFIDNDANTNKEKELILNFLYKSNLLYKIPDNILNSDNSISSGKLIDFFNSSYHKSFKNYFKILEDKKFNDLTEGEKCFYFVTSFYLPYCKYQDEIMEHFFFQEEERTNPSAFNISLDLAMNGNKIVSYLKKLDKDFLIERIQKIYKIEYQQPYLDFVKDL